MNFWVNDQVIQVVNIEREVKYWSESEWFIFGYG